VYRHTFVAGKEPTQKALSLETALVYWELLFSPPGRPWKSASHDWLALWTRFLQDKWTRSVNKDMWNQTLEFANRTIKADGVDFWSEDAAWPSVIDEFVEWFRADGGAAAAAEQ
jgi:DCN1-like protein 1/2